MKKLPEGKILKNILITKDEINFYILLSEDNTIEAAAEQLFLSKRTCEDRMYKLKAELGLHTTTGLVMYLKKKKII